MMSVSGRGSDFKIAGEELSACKNKNALFMVDVQF
jgi:hypothetical protein